MKITPPESGITAFGLAGASFAAVLALATNLPLSPAGLKALYCFALCIPIPIGFYFVIPQAGEVQTAYPRIAKATVVLCTIAFWLSQLGMVAGFYWFFRHAGAGELFGIPIAAFLVISLVLSELRERADEDAKRTKPPAQSVTGAAERGR